MCIPSIGSINISFAEKNLAQSKVATDNRPQEIFKRITDLQENTSPVGERLEASKATIIRNNFGETDLPSAISSRDEASSLSIQKKPKKSLQDIDHQRENHIVGITDLSFTDRQQHNKAVIQLIEAARLRGETPCLFIGRGNHQTVPSNEKNEE